MEQAGKKIHVLAAPQVAVATLGQDGAFLVHHGGMDERIAPAAIAIDRRLVEGHGFQGMALQIVPGEFIGITADNIERRIRFKGGQLLRTAPGQGDVIGIHSRHQLMAALGQALVQSGAESDVFRQGDGVQGRMVDLESVDHLLQFRSEGAVLDQDQVITRHGLVEHALQAQGQMLRFVLGPDRHQNTV